METIEHKIGDTFCLEDETRLKVVEAYSCEGCYFFNNRCTNPEEKCSSPTREDETSIIFKQIKDNNMNDKRYVLISLEEAREWYNSADPFKRDLALRAYNKEELELSYFKILHKLPDDITRKNALKSDMYLKLINTAAYLNNIYPIKYRKEPKENIYYVITSTKHNDSFTYYKGFKIHKIYTAYSEYFILFNSQEAAKQAIDILGDELKILFE